MSGGRDDLDVLESDPLEITGDHICGLQDVGLVFFGGADTGDAEEVFELLKEALLIFASVSDGWG
jgi:hypothetical protein